MILKQAALQYHRQGLNVVPLHPKGKAPALKEWRTYIERRSTIEEVEQWWTDNPDYNIGAVTGKTSEVVVLDIDQPDASAKYDKWRHDYPTARVSQTGGGGYHLHYSYPTYNGAKRIPNRMPVTGIDFKGDAGIIVLPPSIHESGSVYKWISEEEPSELPEKLYRMVVDNQAEEEPAPKSPDWISRLLFEGSSAGNRNNDATRLAGYFTGKSIPPDLVYSMLLGTWYAKVDHNEFPPTELRTIVDSVYKTEQRRKAQPITAAQILPEPQMLQHVKPSSNIIGRQAREVWDIDGWLPRATTALMVAPPGSYKTWLSMALATSIGSGYDIINRKKLPKRRRVLMIQQEDSEVIIANRLRSMYTQIIHDNPDDYGRVDTGNEEELQFVFPDLGVDIYCSPTLMHFSNAEALNLLASLIKTNQYGLVIIDPLYAAADGENYMSKAAQDMVALKQMRDSYECSFLILHHTRKSAANQPASLNRMDAWGSQFLNAWLETGIQLRPGDEPGVVLVRRHYKNAEGASEQTLRLKIKAKSIGEDDEQEHNYSFEVEIEDGITPNDIDDDMSSNARRIWEGLKVHGGTDWITPTQLADKMKSDRGTVGRYLKKFADDGKIDHKARGRYRMPPSNFLNSVDD